MYSYVDGTNMEDTKKQKWTFMMILLIVIYERVFVAQVIHFLLCTLLSTISFSTEQLTCNLAIIIDLSISKYKYIS